MDVFRRIFGLGPKKQALPDPVTIFEREDGTARVRMVPDAGANAALARNALGNILGFDNIPPGFGMGPVIEVKNADGKWAPVSGSKGLQPSLEVQMGYLQSFQETGIIGPQPTNPEGSMAPGTGGIADGTAAQPGDTGGTQPLLTFGPMAAPAPGMSPFFYGVPGQIPFSMGAVQAAPKPETQVKKGQTGSQQPAGQMQGPPALPGVMPMGMPQMPQMGMIDPMLTMNIVRQMFPTNLGGVLQVAPTAQFGGGK